MPDLLERGRTAVAALPFTPAEAGEALSSLGRLPPDKLGRAVEALEAAVARLRNDPDLARRIREAGDAAKAAIAGAAARILKNHTRALETADRRAEENPEDLLAGL